MVSNGFAFRQLLTLNWASDWKLLVHVQEKEGCWEMYVVEYFRIAGSEKGMEDLLWCLLIAQTVSLQDLICASVFPHMPYHVTLVNTEHLQQWP